MEARAAPSAHVPPMRITPKITLPVGKPITVNGIEFGSMVLAAKHYGVHPSTVASAIRNGTTDRLGTGRGSRRAQSQPITYHGKTYPTYQAASDAGHPIKHHPATRQARAFR